MPPEHFQAQPAGTGPFKVVSVTRSVSIELARNDSYWDATRIPKVERLVLLPIPDASTRVAALRSGQVDWIEFKRDGLSAFVATNEIPQNTTARKAKKRGEGMAGA